MFHSIVVPLDGSALGARILPYIPPLAVPGAAVTLVGVVEPHREILPFGRARDAEEEERLRGLLREVLESRAEALRAGGFRVTTAVPTGSAAVEILAHARARNADLIAMTTHGREGFSGLASRSVTHRVLRGTPCPLFVVRPAGCGGDEAVIRTVVVPLDGSALAARALPVAEDLARHFGATVAIVEVVPDDYPPYVYPDDPALVDPVVWEEVVERDRKQAGEYVNAMVARLHADGLPVAGIVREGRPAEELAALIARQPAPLIVAASHERSGLARLALGSVIEQVLTTVACPLLILRATGDEADTAGVGTTAR
jgi:nucleotide-binding universal stress UspA family protein